MDALAAWLNKHPVRALAAAVFVFWCWWFFHHPEAEPAQLEAAVAPPVDLAQAKLERERKDDEDYRKAKAAAAAAEARIPVTAISIAELAQAFSRNELAAERRFAGQKIAMTGRIEKVFVHSEGNPIAVLRENGVRGRCVFGTWMKDFAATLVVGEELRCLGKIMVGGDSNGPDVFMGEVPN